MKFREWLEELEYDVISGDLDIEVEDVIYDSRKAREHVVFVCTKGTKVDSHEFIPEVVKGRGGGTPGRYSCRCDRNPCT